MASKVPEALEVHVARGRPLDRLAGQDRAILVSDELGRPMPGVGGAEQIW